MTSLVAGRLSVLGLIAGAIYAPTAGGELVTNGGFETGNFSGWTTQAASSGSQFYTTNLVRHSGNYSALFAAAGPQPDVIYQNLDTVGAQQYSIGFWLRNASVGADSFQVLWEGSVVFDMTPTVAAFDWKLFSINVTAGGSASELRVRGLDNPSSLQIDDVSVNPVPAPYPLGVIGAAVFAALRRRRR